MQMRLKMVTGVHHNEQPGDLEAGEGAHMTSTCIPHTQGNTELFSAGPCLPPPLPPPPRLSSSVPTLYSSALLSPLFLSPKE